MNDIPLCPIGSRGLTYYSHGCQESGMPDSYITHWKSSLFNLPMRACVSAEGKILSLGVHPLSKRTLCLLYDGVTVFGLELDEFIKLDVPLFYFEFSNQTQLIPKRSCARSAQQPQREFAFLLVGAKPGAD
eukprot:scaffold251904_cov34-Attheya_sp.AAC.1